MKLSIVVPTIGRRSELKRLLESIHRNILNIEYEVIVVDQNVKGYIQDIIEEYSVILDINHQLVSFKGLSKAKNLGARLAKGQYVTFPDDDCEYNATTCALALETLSSKKADIVFGRCVDRNGDDSVLNFKTKSYYLNVKNMQGGFVEATGFIDKKILSDNYLFDEKMGAGQFYGAEEGYDWLFRVLKSSNYRVYYNREITIYHPQVVLDKTSPESLKRVFTYSCGKSYLYKKHKFYFKYSWRLIALILSFPYLIIFRNNTIRYYSLEILGLITGYVLEDKNEH